MLDAPTKTADDDAETVDDNRHRWQRRCEQDAAAAKTVDDWQIEREREVVEKLTGCSDDGEEGEEWWQAGRQARARASGQALAGEGETGRGQADGSGDLAPVRSSWRTRPRPQPGQARRSGGRTGGRAGERAKKTAGGRQPSNGQRKAAKPGATGKKKISEPRARAQAAAEGRQAARWLAGGLLVDFALVRSVRSPAATSSQAPRASYRSLPRSPRRGATKPDAPATTPATSQAGVASEQAGKQETDKRPAGRPACCR
ncbi:uncharacterized protein PSFLO_01572 [Pseudozyma flocculosa]|uniref:Uncharacterized protein n=1 Tax=Pseudozyma flocculosa TaxID=84751 RepID=A0A5C3EYH6_9BASI|nr:uncharacterized protein PSFLO_01572 [Pseudozyma flocculosa]